MKKYDYVIIGAGLFAGVFAHEAIKNGKTCLVIEKRNHLGGNIYCEDIEDIHVHKYGAHIFHTSDKEVWSYVNNLVESGRYLTDSLGRLALDVYEELPRYMKDALFYEKKRIYDKLVEEGWHNVPTYIDRKLEFVYYASSFDICFFKNNN